MADGHGNRVHFGERECSIQRRHQKIIEETPSVVVSQEIREQMGEALDGTIIGGVKTNVGLCRFLLDSEEFVSGRHHTNLLEKMPLDEIKKRSDESDFATLFKHCS
jgi:acetyl/propionyl-CoA carboxylase alpha subunit